MLVQIIKCIRYIFPPKSGTLFLAPDIPISNLGDQALLLGAFEGLSVQKCDPIYVIANGPEEIKNVPRIDAFSNRIIIIQSLNIIFATDRAFTELLAFYWLTRKAKSIVLVGADVLDGRYNEKEAGRKLQIIEKCVDIGLKAKIVGFSLSEHISDSSANGFRRLSNKAEFISRDAVSQARMQKYAPCQLGADCAFLMQPTNLNGVRYLSVIEWLKTPKESVALCLRDEDFMTQDTAQLLDPFVKGLIVALNKQNVKLLLIPHHPTDIKMLRKVADTLNSFEFSDYLLISELPSAQEVKSLVGQCKHIITSRMHVAIASLSMERSITCIPYAGKFEGLYQHFQMFGAGIDRLKLDDETYVAEILEKRIANSDAMKVQLTEKLFHVKSLAQSNFNGL